MTLSDLVEVCEAYLGLGGAVSDQLRDVVVGGESLDNQNGHALRLIGAFLKQQIAARDSEASEDALELAEEIRVYLENSP